ncbi:MAG: YihY/virulence factor BrkB family protein [Planctomycetota bacterium]|nr:MAG: YihY/virulence factor BrkB family protein [Planctomycetota bacterium]
MTRKPRRSILKLLRTVVENWSGDEAPRMAAALAYYTTFSVGPLLLISIAVAGLVFDPESARREILNQLTGLVGLQGAEVVATVVENASRSKGGSIFGTILGGAVLLFGASGVFGELQTSLNRIWRVERKKNRGVLGWLKDRFFNFTMVLGIAFVLLVSLVVSAALQALGGVVHGWFGDVLVMKALYAVVSFGVLTGLFALLFKVVPDARTRWGDVWLGSAITAALFTAGKFLIGLYLGKSGVSGKYGAAGSLVVCLVWIDYSAQILFRGAEFTRVWAEVRGHGVAPDRDAARVRRKTETVSSRS